jgi:peroxiredoxin
MLGGKDSYAKELPEEVLISGALYESAINQPIRFQFYQNFLSLEPTIYPINLQKDSFSIKIPVKDYASGFLSVGNINVPIFIEKGDQIQIQSYLPQFLNSLKYEGKGALKNNYLKAAFELFGKDEAALLKAELSHNSASCYKSFIDEIKQRKEHFQMTFLAERDAQFSPLFTTFLKIDTDYWRATNLLRYQIEHPISKSFPIGLTLSESYLGFMDSLELNNELALKNLNYLSYIDNYSIWRGNRIKKGIIPFKKAPITEKAYVDIKMVESYGEVILEELELREQPYDALTSFKTLPKGTEVLYLQDITNERFLYAYKGLRYSDYFVKVEAPDGQWGWVYKGGIRLKEKVIYAKKQIEVPVRTPEVMRRFKYADFKGEVLHYAIAKDFYQDFLTKKIDIGSLRDYLEKAPKSNYSTILEASLNNFQLENECYEEEYVRVLSEEQLQIFQNSCSNRTILQQLPTLNRGKQKKVAERGMNKDWKIDKPNFEDFSAMTTITGLRSATTLTKPTLIINTNPLLREGTNFLYPEKLASTFRYDFTLNSNTTGQIKLGKEEIDIYLEKGDSLEINLAGNQLYEGLQFKGKGSAINNYLVAAAKQFQGIEPQLLEQIRHAKPDEFKLYLKGVRDKKQLFLSEYCKNNELDPVKIAFLQSDIEYWYAFNLMNYPYEHPIFHNQKAPMELPATYYDFLEELPINNKYALPSKNYLYFLQDYLSHKARNRENRNLSLYEVAKRYLEGEPLYFYQALQISLEIQQRNATNIEPKIRKFFANCPLPLYREYIKLAYNEGKGIVLGRNAPSFELKDVNGKSVALSDYKGKVVLLDFWATWCAPCLHQIPSHQKLQKQFKNQEVVFLYISMDKNKNAWRQFVQNKNLAGIHLTADLEEQKSAIAEKYKVSSLPYTLLISPEGKIAWHHTGGYSVSQLGQKIADLLQ